jgi:hypothetical protein
VDRFEGIRVGRRLEVDTTCQAEAASVARRLELLFESAEL